MSKLKGGHAEFQAIRGNIKKREIFKYKKSCRRVERIYGDDSSSISVLHEIISKNLK